MADFARVNGNVVASTSQIGRAIAYINIAGLSAASVALAQADLNAATQAVETISTVTVIGAFVLDTDTEVNMIIEGVETSGDAYKSAGQDTYDMTYLEKLSELTGKTVTAVAF